MPVALTMLIYGVGFLIRYLLVKSTFIDWLADQKEISTPLTSWKRVVEGYALKSYDVSPYTGDLLHESPLLLGFFSYFIRVWPGFINILFIFCDLLTAFVLDRIGSGVFGKYMLEKQSKQVNRFHIESKNLLLTADKLRWTKYCVLAFYLLNPYVVVVCLSKSTAVIKNLVVALVFYHTLKGNRLVACFVVALAAHLSFYPLMLLVPVAMHLARNEVHGNTFTSPAYLMAVAKSVICFLTFSVFLIWLCYVSEGSWDFISCTYGFRLDVPDLTPNVGIFWYFFTEMFDHFRLFFICVFQIHVFIYTIPLSFRLRDDPIFLMFMILAVYSVFKSYPSYADTGFYTALMPLWAHTLSYMRNALVVSCMFAVSTIMAPILWYLWIYAGSANANFYFAITLVYTTAQVFLVTDILYGYLRREFSLISGPNPKKKDNSPASILLE